MFLPHCQRPALHRIVGLTDGPEVCFVFWVSTRTFYRSMGNRVQSSIFVADVECTAPHGITVG